MFGAFLCVMDSLWQVNTDIFDYLRPSAHRSALNNGASVEEIQEVLLHSLPYCGAPATQEAFRAALEVLAEHTTNT